MADKSFNIEFLPESRALERALDSIDRALSDISSQLNSVNSNLNLDSSGTDSVAQSMNSLQNEASDAAKSVEGGLSGALNDVVGEAGSVEGALDSLSGGADNAGGALGGVGTSLAGVASRAGSAAGPIGIATAALAALATAGISAANSIAQTQQELLNVEAQTGSSAEELRDLQDIFQRLGVESDIRDIGDELADMEDQMRDLDDPSSDAAEALSEFGISAQDIEADSTAQELLNLISATNELTDAQQRQVLQTTLSEEGFRNFIALTRLSEEQLQAYADALGEGSNLTKEQRRELAQLGSENTALNQSLRDLNEQIGSAFAGAGRQFVAIMGDILDVVGPIARGVATLVGELTEFTLWVGRNINIISRLAELFGNIADAFESGNLSDLFRGGGTISIEQTATSDEDGFDLIRDTQQGEEFPTFEEFFEAERDAGKLPDRIREISDLNAELGNLLSQDYAYAINFRKGEFEFNEFTNNLDELGQKLDDTENKIESIQSQNDFGLISDEDVIQEQINQYEQLAKSLIDQRNNFEEGSDVYKIYTSEIEQAVSRIQDLRNELENLNAENQPSLSFGRDDRIQGVGIQPFDTSRELDGFGSSGDIITFGNQLSKINGIYEDGAMPLSSYTDQLNQLKEQVKSSNLAFRDKQSLLNEINEQLQESSVGFQLVSSAVDDAASSFASLLSGQFTSLFSQLFGGPQDNEMSDGQLLNLRQQERQLRQSLANRQITQREFNIRMEEINGEFVESMQEQWTGFADFFTTMFEGIGNFVLDVIDSIITQLVEAITRALALKAINAGLGLIGFGLPGIGGSSIGELFTGFFSQTGPTQSINVNVQGQSRLAGRDIRTSYQKETRVRNRFSV